MSQDDSTSPQPVSRRKGLPAPDTVISETTITSPKGRQYRVLRTNQTDATDEPPAAPPGEASAKPTPRKGARRRKSS